MVYTVVSSFAVEVVCPEIDTKVEEQDVEN